MVFVLNKSLITDNPFPEASSKIKWAFRNFKRKRKYKEVKIFNTLKYWISGCDLNLDL